ncbi:hypothetical protein A2Z22_02980 [Candidatus Woesebacteria bacterium RBG_16_34_12]|uniref:Uncharacterized protein n=1 Tax=Candidatus Woesebacteria bacterium RBG_16_34_12 TaxID=1802480 RepID=A0A1F7X6V3_9BACT|nr:MAG: hypothetical protein A2Z22_02980 [Candidatus Woesebacteria bacterium RBG_16_34_12]
MQEDSDVSKHSNISTNKEALSKNVQNQNPTSINMSNQQVSSVVQTPPQEKKKSILPFLVKKQDNKAEISSIITTLPKPQKSKKLVWIIIGTLVLMILSLGVFYFYSKYSEKNIQPDQSLKSQSAVKLPTQTTVPTPKVEDVIEENKFTNAIFVVNYPKDFKPKFLTSTKTSVYFWLENETNQEIQAIYVSSFSNPDNLTFTDWLKEQESYMDVNSELVYTEEILGTETWFIFDKEVPPLSFAESGKYYWANVKEDKITLAGIIGLDYSEYKSLVEDILTTFQYVSEEKVISCSLISGESLELAFLESYCLGTMCSPAVTKSECEAVDVVSVATETGRLLEESQTDGIGDCLWDEQASGFISKCKIKYE